MAMSVYGRHGQIVRVAYLLAAIAWWLGSVPGRLLRGGCRRTVVLCYHGIGEAQRKRFAWQMAHLADRAIDPADLEAAPTAETWRPRVCVTFDDAFANLLVNALPVMQQLEVPATIFAVPGNLDDRPHWTMEPHHPESTERLMSANQIRRAHNGLCRIGSHTLTHADLTRLTAAQLHEELAQSRQQLQRLLGQDVEDLAVPFGAYDASVLTAARTAGYRRVFTLEPCLEPAGAGAIGRFSMAPDAWRMEFRLTCAGAYAWLRPWRRLLRQLRGRRPINPRKEPALV